MRLVLILAAVLAGCCGVPRNDIRELGFALAGSIAVAVALAWRWP